MATILTPSFDYTYPGKLNTEFFAAPTVDDYNLLDVFRVINGIRSGQQLNLLGRLGKGLKAHSGCSPDYTQAGTTVTNRKITTSLLELPYSFCATDFDDEVLEALRRSGVNAEDITGTTWETVIRELLEQNLREEIFRLFSWGDTADADADWNAIDGMWKILIAAEDDAGARKIGANGLTGAAGTDITVLDQNEGNRAIDYLRNMWELSETTLRAKSKREKVFLVTPNIIDNLATYFENQSGSDLAIRKTEDGQDTYTFRGVPITPVMQWEENLDDATNPFFATIDTAIIYTVPDNHVLGVDDRSDEMNIQIWYDKTDRKVYTDAAMNIGYQFVQDGLTSISYGKLL